MGNNNYDPNLRRGKTPERGNNGFKVSIHWWRQVQKTALQEGEVAGNLVEIGRRQDA